MIRKMMWAVLVVGVALIAAPFVMGLPDKAGGGQQMIDAFAPIMEEQNVELTAAYYYDVFVPLGDVVPAMTQENIDKFNGYLAGFTAVGLVGEAHREGCDDQRHTDHEHGPHHLADHLIRPFLEAVGGRPPSGDPPPCGLVQTGTLVPRCMRTHP